MPRQKFQSADIHPRYPKGRVSAFGVNSVYPRIPWVAGWWSFTFPGFGHMFLGKYLHGFILIIWEIIVNNMANLNMGIALSMLGRFEEAKAVLNEDWILLYILNGFGLIGSGTGGFFSLRNDLSMKTLLLEKDVYFYA
ncbi:DUF3231 family protein [Niallia endozanthoxylica]|uniref:DUF3231 family protein n=1 Tax=Niallia endozanthoxylica TaxID=2036016 RepID=UPI001CC82773|nr:DUF3231 family protein [Niallia endozanthoxylica]